MDYSKIEKDFIERTRNLIDSYEGPYEVTFLINCCIGLLVLPKERHYESIPETEIPEDTELWGISQTSIIKCTPKDYGLKNMVRRIRNGLCHFRLETVANSHGEITTIRIKDKNDRQAHDQFEVLLSVEQFKKFSISVAEHVLSK